MNPILLDTHAAIWASEGKLASRIQKMIGDAARREQLLLSPFSAWEIGMLVQKGRLALTSTAHDYVRALFGRSGVVLAALTPAIAVSAAGLPGVPHNDPVDRILIATAAAYGAALLTRDRRILEYAKATRYLSCVAC